MRADLALVEKGLCPSRAQAQLFIEQGRVLMCNGTNQTSVVKKASQQVDPHMTLKLLPSHTPTFVSRGGLKLHHALEHTQLKVSGKKCIDLGQSTGGFTDCLLQRGALSVVGIDVGNNQLHSMLRENPSVLVFERMNFYKVNINQLEQDIAVLRPEFIPFQLAVADLSFISLRKVLPNLAQMMPLSCEGLFLVKPQFELSPECIGKNGLVKNPSAFIATLENDVRTCCSQLGLQVKDFFPCELKGGDGNQEYFLYAVKQSAAQTIQTVN